MRSSWLVILAIAVSACQQAIGAPVPTAEVVPPPTVMVEATPIQLPATPTVEVMVEETSESEADPAVQVGCLSAKDVQYDLRQATQKLVDGGQAPSWEAPSTLQVEFVKVSDENVALRCVYELRIWGERYDEFSDVKNVELFTREDFLSLSVAVQADYPGSLLTIFDWNDGLRATIADGSVNFSKYHGGFLLYLPYITRLP